MDFNIKKPLHILALLSLILSFLILILLPFFSFFCFFGAADTDTIEQINELSDTFRLIVEIIALVVQFALVVFLMILVPFIWYFLVNRYKLKKIFESLKLKKEGIKKALFYGLIATIVMIAVLAALNYILINSGFQAEDLDNTQNLTNIFSPLTLFILVCFQPIPEEIFFRGFLLEKIDFLWGKEAAVVFTSVLFGVAHLTYQSYIPALLIVVIGFILGFIVLKTRNLYSSVFAHVLFNLTSFILLMFS